MEFPATLAKQSQDFNPWVRFSPDGVYALSDFTSKTDWLVTFARAIPASGGWSLHPQVEYRCPREQKSWDDFLVNNLQHFQSHF